MTVRTALIGHSGFVGGTLRQARSYDDLYNSSNIEDISGKRYDLVVCAGVSAVKWLANKEPEQDRRGIARLTDALTTVEADEFILISTIDVYPDPSLPTDEDAALAALDNHPYGRHRLDLESWIRSRFAGARVVRLPALFGTGLRKNALYDLIHGNRVDAINPAARFQWYPTSKLQADLDRVREADLRLVNLFPEPISMSEIIEAHFPDAQVVAPTLPAPSYDVRTKFDALFGGRDGYIASEDMILAALAEFVAAERRGLAGAA